MLSGCMESGSTREGQDETSLEDKKKQSLNTAETFYGFPADGQSDIAVNSNILLAFSHHIKDINDVEFVLKNSEGNVVDVTITSLNENLSGLSIKPVNALLPGQRYTMAYSVPLIKSNEIEETPPVEETPPAEQPDIELLNAVDNDVEAPVSDQMTVVNETSFITRMERDSNVFSVDEYSFFPSDDLPVTTFTSFRLRLTNEVQPETLVLGEGFQFIKQGTGEQVEGELIVKGRYITFDPTQDLDKNATYQMVLTSDVKDRSGTALVGIEKTYTVQDGGVHSFSTMEVTKNTGEKSQYSGGLTNVVSIQSSLIGNKDRTYVEADLVTELANPGMFTGSGPLTIRKGTVMNASSLSVKVGGRFPAGFDTGNIRMTTISDATGYLIENTSSDHKYAPKQLRLLMDVAMTTDGYMDESGLNGKANGALSQNIMHLDVLGTVRSEGTQLIIDAIGEIDLKILGLENANAQVSFHMESYKADDAPIIPTDHEPAMLQSSYPAENRSNFSLGDNIIFNFNEPLAVSSLSTLTLKDKRNTLIPIRVSQDGASIVVDPIDKLDPLETYTVEADLIDLAGNSTRLDSTFETQHHVQDNRKTAPMVMAMVPGYSCAMHGHDYANDIAGKCAGSEIEKGKSDYDYFTIFGLQEDREIYIAFNQQMDEDSVILGSTCDTGTFRVEVVNQAGECLSAVPGTMEYNNRILTFKPSQRWADLGDNLYRYKLKTVKFASKGDVNCKDGSTLCSESGYPLQTSLLKNKSVEHEGGPDMNIPFRAKPADNLVFAPLMMPTTDSNYDARWDRNNEPVLGGNFARLAVTDWGGLITWALLGCPKGQDKNCPEDNFKTFINGFMPTEIGEYDPIHDRIPVKIHAQQLISSEVYVQTFIIGIPASVPTATMIMRPIYPKVKGKTTIPEGYIIWNEEEGRLNFKIDLDVYMDSPFMEVPLGLHHNLHSYRITMNLQGPIEFLDDGRMQISLRNKNSIDIVVDIGGTADMTLNIAPGQVSLQQISMPMK